MRQTLQTLAFSLAFNVPILALVIWQLAHLSRRSEGGIAARRMRPRPNKLYRQ